MLRKDIQIAFYVQKQMDRTPPLARPLRRPDIHGAQHFEDLRADDLQSAYAVDGADSDGGEAKKSTPKGMHFYP